MPQNLRHIKEFSKNSKYYNQHNIIQKEVAKYLICKISSQPSSILDLGSGNGAIYSQIDWDINRFVAVDRSQKMCELHPRGENIEVICEDFDNESLFENLGYFDLITASSSLQWSSDLDLALSFIAKHTKEVALAIFCDKTFNRIYKMSGKKSFYQVQIN
jgi:malonyl-CoA O-methyltransferase